MVNCDCSLSNVIKFGLSAPPPAPLSGEIGLPGPIFMVPVLFYREDRTPSVRIGLFLSSRKLSSVNSCCNLNLTKTLRKNMINNHQALELRHVHRGVSSVSENPHWIRVIGASLSKSHIDHDNVPPHAE